MSEKWEVVEAFGADVRIEDSEGNLICALCYELGNGEYVVTQCWDDHAPRIAALPELEANYKEAVEALRRLYNALDSCMELTPDVMRNAQTAIAKAEGK